MEAEITILPSGLMEAIRHYSDPKVCVDEVALVRWPRGPVCPRCHGQVLSFLTTRLMWKCRACKKQFSVKVGTIFEDSPIGLDKWLCAMWMLANCKNGVSSYEVGRALKVTQRTAWFMLHRIRYAIHHGTFDKMTGECEADETFIGGKARNMHTIKRERRITGTGTVDKTAVMGVLQRGDKAKGTTSKVHATVVSSRKKKELQAEVRKHVEAGSALYTDALLSYEGLAGDFAHQVVDHAVKYVDGCVHTNGLENFWSLLKRMINGTYVSVEPFHLFRYLDEESFRFNERKATDAERFGKVLGSISGKRLTWDVLTCKEAG